MGQYNIHEFSSITGITKFVLRTWENRYDYLKADRTATNVRVYNDKMIIRALNTNILLNSGFKISKVSALSTKEMNKIIEELELSSSKKDNSHFVKNLIISVIDLDNDLFHKTYDAGVLEFGVKDFYKIVVLEVLKRIGVLWLTDSVSPSQEHIFTANLKQKILSQVEKHKTINKEKENWLLFLPENELHDIGLLFAYLLLVENNYPVIYLGPNLPIYALKEVKEKVKINNILMFTMCNQSSNNTISALDYIDENFKESKCFLVNNCVDIKNLTVYNNLSLIKSVDDFIKIIS